MKNLRTFCIFHLENCIHRRDFNKTICIYFIIKEEIVFVTNNEVLAV